MEMVKVIAGFRQNDEIVERLWGGLDDIPRVDCTGNPEDPDSECYETERFFICVDGARVAGLHAMYFIKDSLVWASKKAPSVALTLYELYMKYLDETEALLRLEELGFSFSRIVIREKEYKDKTPDYTADIEFILY